MNIIWNLLLLSVSIFAVSSLMPSIRIKSFTTSVIVAATYSGINLLVGGLLSFLAMPFIFLTLGLFTFIINAFLLWITDQIIEDFEIKGFGSTLLAAFLITVIQSGLQWIF